MNIIVDPPLEKFIEEQIKSGRFKTPEEVVHAALTSFRAEAKFSVDDLEELREEIKIGLDQADRGEFVEFDAEDIIREGREILVKQPRAS